MVVKITARGSSCREVASLLANERAGEHLLESPALEVAAGMTTDTAPVLTIGATIKSKASFNRDAKLLASLNHPDIAAIYGLEESCGFVRKENEGIATESRATATRVVLLQCVAENRAHQ